MLNGLRGMECSSKAAPAPQSVEWPRSALGEALWSTNPGVQRATGAAMSLPAPPETWLQHPLPCCPSKVISLHERGLSTMLVTDGSCSVCPSLYTELILLSFTPRLPPRLDLLLPYTRLGCRNLLLALSAASGSQWGMPLFGLPKSGLTKISVKQSPAKQTSHGAVW